MSIIKSDYIRRPPTDADAVDVPRRPCWVRHAPIDEWEPAQLLAVDNTRPVPENLYICMLNGRTSEFYYCEIEVKKEVRDIEKEARDEEAREWAGYDSLETDW
jgi:hypothetical protein